MRSLSLAAALLWQLHTAAQLYIEPHAIFVLQRNATLSVDSSVVANSDILGDGTLHISGSTSSLDMQGHRLPQLSIQVREMLVLQSAATINAGLHLEQGRLVCGNHQITIGADAVISGASPERNIVTNE
ncbi:MAG TPA: hypothetical protein VK666_19000, partial [Chryseolinea sp.]|nr:hypothetical protein [Chryseolinea sp.]